MANRNGNHATRTLWRQQAAATPAGARTLREGLQPLLTRLGVDRATQDALLLAVAELAVNPGRHAAPPAATVSLAFGSEAGHWVLELEDDGGPFTDFAEAWSAPPADLLDESGRGLALVAALLPDVDYRPGTEGRRNRLRLRAPRSVPRPTVLLVDDDVPTLRLMAAYLERDYRVRASATVEAALTELASGEVDLVVSDVRMPGADGIELRRRLAENAGTDVLPFVFLSGLPEEATAAGDLAVDDYLIKPVDAARLRAVVARVLARARQVRTRLGDRLDRAITERLKPALPARLGPFRAEVRTRAGGSGGGDLLFCRPCADGHLLVLADVMGHDSSAKFFAHALAGYLHGLLASTGGDDAPGDLLGRLSAALATDAVLGETLVTLLVARLGDDGAVRLAAAGHPGPWRLVAGAVERVEVAGPLPGFGGAGDYPETRLDPGGRLLLFTDGLVERRGDPATEEALATALDGALAGTAGQPLARAADALWAVAVDGEAPPDDDATLVLLEPA